MSKKIVNLDASGNSETIVLLDIWDVAARIGVSASKLQRWERNPEIATPKPAFSLDGRANWTEDQLEAWKTLYNSQVETDITALKYSKEMLVNELLSQAKDVARQASYAYNHSRRYNKKNTREAILALEGVYKFVAALGNSGSYLDSIIEPFEKRKEIDELIAKAKSAIGMTD